ncbi:MAG: sulfatase-like hydrolase/transferase [Acidobacteria bacterium]|nr:sulfatase-like hydrolase/transferase [Acidobacteriota bacterium]
MNRRLFIGLTSAGAFGAAVHGNKAQAEAETVPANTPKSSKQSKGSHPNIVIFMPDEMRADSLACYGNPITKTPNFDRLSQEGARFANCHVQFPVCAASRCAMLTGWPTSVRGHRSLFYLLRPEEPNLFRYLRKAGYDVFWFGKNDALATQSFADSVTRWGESRAASRGESRDLTPGSYSMLYSASGERRDTKDYKHLQMAFDIFEQKERDRPFCVFLPLSQPHPPYTVPKDFYDLYSAKDIPSLIPAGLPKKPEFHDAMRSTYGLNKLSEETFRQIRAVYYAQVSYSDWLLGELRESLEKNGIAHNTALFVTSDHGDYAGDYGLVEKWPSGLEDCLTHVPMIANIPGGKGHVVANNMIEMYDLMQTCADLAGARIDHTHFSRSLLPQIHGASGDPQRAAFSEGGYNEYEPQCFEPAGAGGSMYRGKIQLQNKNTLTVARSSMVRTETHKLIIRSQGMQELYDLTADPNETQNLIDQPSYSEIQSNLQTKLLRRYLNTTGIAPMDKDPRDLPPFYPTRHDLPQSGWHRTILDS